MTRFIISWFWAFTLTIVGIGLWAMWRVVR